MRGISKHPIMDWGKDGRASGPNGVQRVEESERVESERRKRVNHQRLHPSCPMFHAWPFRYGIFSVSSGTKLSRDRALPHGWHVGRSPEHGRLRLATAFHPVYTGKRGACEPGLWLNEWTHDWGVWCGSVTRAPAEFRKGISRTLKEQMSNGFFDAVAVVPPAVRISNAKVKMRSGRGFENRKGLEWVQVWIRAANSPPLPNSGNLVPELELGKLFTGGGRRRRCDGLSVGKVCEIRNGKVPGEDWSATRCEVYSGHLSLFERCCGAAGNPPEVLRKAFTTGQKQTNSVR